MTGTCAALNFGGAIIATMFLAGAAFLGYLLGKAERNFPNYSVGLDSTLNAIRQIDYERGLDDAAQICDDSFEFSTNIGQCAYQGNMGDAIRALKVPAPQAGHPIEDARSDHAQPAEAGPEPTDEQLFAAYWKDQERTNFYSHSPAQIANGLRNVYFMGMEDA